jgi:anthranilate synthase component 2
MRREFRWRRSNILAEKFLSSVSVLGIRVYAKQLMHGKTSPIFHNNTSVFRGLPSPFTATRYHSLVIERESLPDCLEITAWTEDGEIMGVRHRTLAVEGVQFHPESILTEHGHDMLKNFLQGIN